MAIRILQSGSWRLGAGYPDVPAGGEQLREARWQAARNVVDAARRNRVDALLLVGDTFAHPAMGSAAVQRARDLLGAAGCTVVVLPGTSDPLIPGSVWERDTWSEAPNVRLLRPGESLVLAPNGTVHALDPVRRAHDVRHDNAGDTAPAGGAGVQVAVAYPEPPPAALEVLGKRFDYLAVGGSLAATIHGPRVAAAGTPEPTTFEPPGAGVALLVEIETGGAPPRIEIVPTAATHWHTESVAVASWSDVVDVERRLCDLATEFGEGTAPRVVARLVLSGALPLADRPRVERLTARLEQAGVAAAVDVSAVAWHAPNEAWSRQLPPGPIREAAKRLHQAANDPKSSDALAWLLSYTDAHLERAEDAAIVEHDSYGADAPASDSTD